MNIQNGAGTTDKTRTTLTEDIAALRAIPAKWKGLYNPLEDARRIREEEDRAASTQHFYDCSTCGEHVHCVEYTKLVVKDASAKERLGQIEWFQSLLASIDSGDLESARKGIAAAIDLLRKG